jgi:hypothetical protein
LIFIFCFVFGVGSGQIFSDVFRLQIHRDVERNAAQRRRTASRNPQADPAENTKDGTTNAVASIIAKFFVVHLLIVQEFVPKEEWTSTSAATTTTAAAATTQS